MVQFSNRLLFKRFLMSVGLITLLRLGFFIFNWKYFGLDDLVQTLWAFIKGLRFDLVTATQLCTPYILLSLIPLRSKWYNHLLKFVFFAPQFLATALILTDYEFFLFNGKLLTYDIFLMKSDIKGQFSQVVAYYWPITTVIFVVAGLFWWRIPNETRPYQNFVWKRYGLHVLGILLLFLIGFRGGVQMRPLSPKNAFVFKKYELGNLALNSMFTLMHSVAHRAKVRKVSYFESDQAARFEILKQRSFNHDPKNFQKQNVVVIIIESMASEYIEQGYAPFLAGLQKKGLSFEGSFANGRRSIEALPSILNGLPSIIGTPLSQSSFQSNRYYGLPYYLKKAGYSTHFFHAGAKGTMDFDSYCYSLGFDRYYSKDDYPNQDHFDGNWGIFDHHYLNHLADSFGHLAKPFFSGVFTLSSHQPYTMPKGHQNRYSTGVLEIHESIGYVDQALKEFFERIKDKDWYQDTLFVITADHTQKLASQRYQSLLGRFSVPIIYYHPRIDLRSYKKERKITQHADILPSLVDFLGLAMEPRLYFGQSVFSEGLGLMINYNSGNLMIYQGDVLLVYNPVGPLFYRVGSNHLKLTEFSPDQATKERMIKLAKAYLQYTLNGLTKNAIYQSP